MRTAAVLSAAAAADTEALRRQLRDYAGCHPAEAAVVAQFVALLDDPGDPFLRSHLHGHFTGSAWLVDGDGRRVLLTHHRKLERWFQLGGHADGDRDLARVALREAEEESGLAGLTLLPASVDAAIFDLDRHWIPERAAVPGHWHYDVRYLVRAGGAELFTVSDESLALAWRSIADLLAQSDLEPSLRRMAQKWQRRDG